MSQYLILIYEDEKAYAAQDPSVWQTAMEAHGRFAEQVVEHGGKILGGEALQPTGTATSVRGDTVTDGPFAETKEALGGFYLIHFRQERCRRRCGHWSAEQRRSQQRTISGAQSVF